MNLNKVVKKIQKRAIIISLIVSVFSFLMLIILYSEGFSSDGLLVQWILYFFIFGGAIMISSCISLFASYLGELRERRYNKKFSKNIVFWLKKEKFGYKNEFSKGIFEKYKEFPSTKKNSIEKLVYLRQCFKQEYSFKELKMWKLYFDMKRDSILSTTMIISTIFSFSFISFVLQQTPKVYDMTLTIFDSIPLAIMYSILFILFISSLLFGVWANIYISERNYRTYYPIICSLLEEYENEKIKKRQRRKGKRCHTEATNK